LEYEKRGIEIRKYQDLGIRKDVGFFRKSYRLRIFQIILKFEQKIKSIFRGKFRNYQRFRR